MALVPVLAVWIAYGSLTLWRSLAIAGKFVTLPTGRCNLYTSDYTVCSQWALLADCLGIRNFSVTFVVTMLVVLMSRNIYG